MRILFWPVHGSYASAFFQGPHEYLLPWSPARDPYAPGRGAYDDFWPVSVREAAVERLREEPVDLVVVQRTEEIPLAERWLGRRLGRSVPALFLEHNTPAGDVRGMRHPLADRTDIPIVHVTHFNRVYWDSGRAPTFVVEHGVLDPGPRYTGALPRLGAVINEPARRSRVTGADLLPRFADAAPVDLFGIAGDQLVSRLRLGPERLRWAGDIPMTRMLPQLAQRRIYVHPNRWTSLGLALLEAMHLGMPVLALAATEAPRAVPPEAGMVSTDVDQLVAAARRMLADRSEAAERGAAARRFALEHYGLARFLGDWDAVLTQVARAD